MSDKLEALSQPVAYDYQIAGACIADGNRYKWVDWGVELRHECPPDWMVEEGRVKDLKPRYSQEYVTALIQSAEAAEQRLQPLVKLPAAEGDAEQNYLDKVIEVLNSVGVHIRYNCPRCNGLLDLTCRPNGAHYCHQQAKAEIR